MRGLDLFSGVGLFSLGMEEAGIETVAACELMEWKRLIFSELCGDVPLYHDVKELTGQQVLDDAGPIDIVFGSPPCQDASTANTNGRGVDGEQTGLFFEAIRIIGEIRPDWIALENVPGIRTRGADRVLADLERLGYAVWPIVVGADNLGAPHIRKRVWFVGLRADAGSGRVRQQPRRRGGQNGQGAALSETADNPNPHGHGRQHAGGRGQRGDISAAGAVHEHCETGSCCFDPNRCDGNDCWLARNPQYAPEPVEPGELPAHNPSLGRRAGRQGRSDTGGKGQPEQALQAAADATEGGRNGTSWDVSVGGQPWAETEIEGDRLAFWQSLAGDHGPQLAALERDIGPAIHEWAGGLGGYLRLADGCPAKTARMLMSACGDGVVVEVAEAIGRAILQADRGLRP